MGGGVAIHGQMAPSLTVAMNVPASFRPANGATNTVLKTFSVYNQWKVRSAGRTGLTENLKRSNVERMEVLVEGGEEKKKGVPPMSLS